ncbi:MAG TPA: hypothetical protein VHD36_04795 [Pirellulales bacterium]|nr:hypothetical protein [Pirellulales bacterium]
MALVDVNWKPTGRQLRQFGVMALVALPLAGWLFTGKPWPAEATRTQATVIGALAALGALAAVLAFVRPQTLRWPFVGATLLALPIGLVVGEVVLAVIYFGLFLPVSMIFRLMGRDALDRRIDRKAKSYWQPKTRPTGPESYFRQS